MKFGIGLEEFTKILSNSKILLFLNSKYKQRGGGVVQPDLVGSVSKCLFHYGIKCGKEVRKTVLPNRGILAFGEGKNNALQMDYR